jgi:deoxyribodipyrimidine photolyase-related protein
VDKKPRESVRHLVLVLGDQLDEHSAAFDGLDPSTDVVWMAEVVGEEQLVWSSKPRIAIFLSAVRDFREHSLLPVAWVLYSGLANR